MTAISTIYDNLYLLVETLFPTRTMLPDQRNLESNPSIFLRNGVAINWGDGDANDELAGRAYSEERNVSIILTGRIARLDTNTEAKKLVEKAIFEDRRSLINQVKKNSPSLKGAEYFEFVSDEGILSVDDEKQNIIYLKINFSIRYSEVVS